MTERKFVVVVDIQNDFMRPDGALYVGGADALIDPIRDYLSTLDPKAIEGVLFTYDTHTAKTYPGSAEALQFPPHCYQDTPGWELVVPAEIVPNGIPVYTLEKNVFSMWEGFVDIHSERDDEDPLVRDDFFRNLRTNRQTNIDTIIVLGVASDYCIRWTVDGLLERGFRVEIPEGLTKGIAAEMPEVVQQAFADQPVRVV